MEVKGWINPAFNIEECIIRGMVEWIIGSDWYFLLQRNRETNSESDSNCIVDVVLLLNYFFLPYHSNKQYPYWQSHVCGRNLCDHFQILDLLSCNKKLTLKTISITSILHPLIQPKSITTSLGIVFPDIKF